MRTNVVGMGLDAPRCPGEGRDRATSCVRTHQRTAIACNAGRFQWSCAQRTLRHSAQPAVLLADPWRPAVVACAMRTNVVVVGLDAPRCPGEGRDRATSCVRTHQRTAIACNAGRFQWSCAQRTLRHSAQPAVLLADPWRPAVVACAMRTNVVVVGLDAPRCPGEGRDRATSCVRTHQRTAIACNAGRFHWSCAQRTLRRSAQAALLLADP